MLPWVILMSQYVLFLLLFLQPHVVTGGRYVRDIASGNPWTGRPWAAVGLGTSAGGCVTG